MAEFGVNALGFWRKHDDGTLECWNESLGELDTQQAIGSQFRSETVIFWDFPHPFFGSPVVIASADNNTARWAVASSPSAAGVQIRQYCFVASDAPIRTRGYAIGRWKDIEKPNDIFTILAMGQSNMRRGYANSGAAWSMPTDMLVWDNQNNLLDNQTGLGEAWVLPMFGAHPFGSGCNNLAAHCAKHFSIKTGRPVRLIMVATDGKSISNWSDGGSRQALYARTAAVLSAAGVGNVDALLWHQGEADNSASQAADYQGRFEAMVGFMREDGWLSRGTPIVIGTPCSSHVYILPVLKTIADKYPNIALADIRNLTVGDGVHFTGDSLVSAGTIYSDRLRDLLRV